SILMRRPFPADGGLEMTCPWECPEVKDTLMRIPNWPALVCGWMLAASIGQSVFAAPPAGGPSGGVNYAIEDDDEESFGGPPAMPAGFNPYQQVQYTGEGGFQGNSADPNAFFGPGMTPPNAWPETSPYTQHRVESTYNNR